MVSTRWLVQHLFSTFPRGRVGAGLLLLRLFVGLVVVPHFVGTDAAGAVAGLLMLIGFLTPLAAAWVAGALALAQVVAPPSDVNSLSALLLVSGGVAIVLLGPGAFSIDARLFGRREIVIPHRRSR